ncbi:MAG: DUF2071 domain-containing protein [Bacteroidia bacterium]|jgi:hypothetical protein|nr:DUF2071 domain-containing protein [Bacteroidia bacterium]
MNLLKQIPITYSGQLHQIRLINFYVDADEVRALLPAPLKLRLVNGRALISMINVSLQKMRASFMPPVFDFSYYHAGFRLLVDDSELNGGVSKGVYFLQSFTDKPLMQMGGNLLTNYRFSQANITVIDNMLELRSGTKFLNWAIDTAHSGTGNEQLRETIASIDRAYSVANGQVKMVRILRERWPIRPAEGYLFETNFFTTARFAGAFVVDQKIDYTWLPAHEIKHAS